MVLATAHRSGNEGLAPGPAQWDRVRDGLSTRTRISGWHTSTIKVGLRNAAIRALWPRANTDRLAEIAGQQKLRSARVRACEQVEG